MPDVILCKICGKRRARRACPAVRGDICTLCCGTEREVTLSCPLECEYLREAHLHEKPIPVPENQLAYSDIVVSEDFLREYEELFLFCIYSLLEISLRTSGAVDSDATAALEALIQTHRTLESGLYYETRPQNTVAASIQRGFEESLTDYQKVRAEREGRSPARNFDLLKVLVFLYRLAQQNQNGRARGRMYLDLLRQMTPDTRVEEPTPSIIL